MVFVIVVITSVSSADKKAEKMILDISYTPMHESQHEITIQNPKISAEIPPALNDKIQSYCTKNSITISELIRRAVNDYIDNH